MIAHYAADLFVFTWPHLHTAEAATPMLLVLALPLLPAVSAGCSLLVARWRGALLLRPR